MTDDNAAAPPAEVVAPVEAVPPGDPAASDPNLGAVPPAPAADDQPAEPDQPASVDGVGARTTPRSDEGPTQPKGKSERHVSPAPSPPGPASGSASPSPRRYCRSRRARPAHGASCRHPDERPGSGATGDLACRYAWLRRRAPATPSGRLPSGCSAETPRPRGGSPARSIGCGPLNEGANRHGRSGSVDGRHQAPPCAQRHWRRARRPGPFSVATSIPARIHRRKRAHDRAFGQPQAPHRLHFSSAPPPSVTRTGLERRLRAHPQESLDRT